ncbi:polyphosphate kinase 1 [Haloferax sp. MBLA0076]|uniref:Polyphosphate kinase n=1 Tax=Haloferax litoreum TaxID=2666140 RepID=A0A6A8GGF7_9EURY|nr:MULTISPECIES: polyphosphate kinase 1 [Haloferax]KAB1193722.1 polyphosphate kinase 1 [Haloferax sp. CBA1148]MRX22253.1 polyphosphate kinase 1 [Haloferax litoreum]
MSEDEAHSGEPIDYDGGQATTAQSPTTKPVRVGPLTDAPVVPETADLSDTSLYLNRELSELSFHERVLNEALDERNPLFERVKFLSILTSNLDEFFMKRVGGLKQQIAADVTVLSPDGRTPYEQWTLVLERARDLLDRQTACFRDLVRPALADAGIEIVAYDALSSDEQAALRDYFEASVLPTLTPLTFDPAHPFPFISNLSLSLAVLTREHEDAPTKFSRVKVPGNRPRLVDVDDIVGRTMDADSETLGRTAHAPTRFVPLARVIEHNLDLLFPNVEVLDASTFRVTRNAEVRRNEEVAEGLIEMIEDVLRQRRFATVVRLEVEDDTPDAVRDLLVEQLGLDDREVFEREIPLDFTGLTTLFDLDRQELEVDPWHPQPHPRFVGLSTDDPGALFAEVARKDVLVHHPYHSFTGTVGTFLGAAANDPSVLAIKATIYRTAPDSEVIETLIEAASNGIQVAVMVELKARFDEENNLRWVRRLEEEGIHVAYGTIGLKTHTKTALVVREENDGVQLYSHVATGNYHSQTAKLYTDLGLFTADPDIGHDLVRLFNYFTGHSRHESYRKLLVAPTNLREEMTRLVRREADHARAGRDARIVAKMNSLEDPEMVRELYEASMAGVDIDLVVRGICRLRPGIDGISETISVSSVVGRFLEHSRIFYFENAGDPDYYVGSADWMTRNLDRRVEAITPVVDPSLRVELDAVLEALLSDNRRRWVMDADGRYHQLRPADDAHEVEAHTVLMNRALGETYRSKNGEHES